MCGNLADPGTVSGEPSRTWKGSVARKSESARARLKMYMLVAVFILVYLRPEQIEDKNNHFLSLSDPGGEKTWSHATRRRTAVKMELS